MLNRCLLPVAGCLGVALLAGCGEEPLPAGQYTYTDADQDGYPSQVDCDDADRQVNPGATEACDGVDNNCDGVVDEAGADGATEFYADFDRDGYGVFAYVVLACEAPTGYAAAFGDCDDFNDEVHPDANEVCDGLDNDCDDTVDGAYAEGQNTYFRDADADGFGNADSPQTGCSAPVGYVVDVGDCDDSDATVYEGAPELCEDGVDNNCDGLLDEVCPFYLTDDADIIFKADGQYDRAGDTLSAGADLNGDGNADLVVGASQNDDGSLNGGAAFVIYGPVTFPADRADWDPSTMDNVELLSTASVQLVGSSSNDYFGARVWAGPDVDGDGYDELLVGANLAGSNRNGEAYLFHGPLTGGASAIAALDADVRFIADPNETSGDFGEYVLKVVGDLNDDGTADLLVGDHLFRGVGGEDGTGRVYVFSGTAAGTVQVDDAVATVTGHVARAYVGYSAAASRPGGVGTDINGDGVADLAVGAPGEDETWIFHGPLSGDLTRDDADTILTGSSNDWLGSNAASGDVNGDGYADLAVGSSYDDLGGDRSGSVYVFHGPITGDIAYESGSPFADFSVNELDSLVYMGSQVNGLELVDLDEDGMDDLFVGSGGNSDLRDDAGAAFLYFGPAEGAATIWDADRTVRGDGNTDNAGYALGVADMNGDGKQDILLGAEGFGLEEGAVGIFSGARFY